MGSASESYVATCALVCARRALNTGVSLIGAAASEVQSLTTS